MRITGRRVARLLSVAVGCLFLMGSLAPPAHAVPVTFTNSASITIPSSGNATPYPSPIAASGLQQFLTSLTVTLNSFDHTCTDDVGVVLVGPGGQAFLLMDGAGAPAPPTVTTCTSLTDVTFTLSDSGSTALPNDSAWTNGTYRPAAYYVGDDFPAPGPGTAYASPAPAGSATLIQTFGGTNPNGTWNLYVRDFATGDMGDFSGGWSITIDSSSTPPPAISINDVTVAEGNAGPTNAVFNVTLSSSSTSTVTVNFATANGTATAPSDYTTTSGTATFAPSDTSENVTVPVIGDTVDEPNETFVVNLTSPINATLADAQGQGTITDDDLPAVAPQPKSVSLKANKKSVPAGRKVKLTAVVSPCQGHQGHTIDLMKGAKKLQTKASNGACTAIFTVKIKKKTSFTAVSPQQDADHLAGTSNKVTVKVRRRT